MNDIFKSAEVINKVELESWLTENAENPIDEENIKNNISKIQSLLGTNTIRITDSEETKNPEAYRELIREVSKGDNFYVTEGGAEYKLGESSDGTKVVMYTPDNYYRGYTAVFIK